MIAVIPNVSSIKPAYIYTKREKTNNQDIYTKREKINDNKNKIVIKECQAIIQKISKNFRTAYFGEPQK